jgi:hypothetical protein
LAYVYKPNVPTTDTINDVVIRTPENWKWIRIKHRSPAGANLSGGLQNCKVQNWLGASAIVSTFPIRDHSFRINDFGPNIEIGMSAYLVSGSSILAWQNSITGDGSLGETVLGTDPFVTKYVSLPSSGIPGKSATVEPWARLSFGNGWYLSSRYNGDTAYVPFGEVATMHVSSNQQITPANPLFDRFPSTLLMSRPVPDVYSLEGAHFEAAVQVSAAGAFGTIDRTRASGYNPPLSDPYATIWTLAGHNDSINLGAGPEFGVATWYNYPESRSWYTPRLGIGGMFRSAGGAIDANFLAPDRQIQHTLLRNGELYYSGTDDNYIRLSFVFPPGSYHMTSQRQVAVHGVSTQATTESSFTINTRKENEQNPVDQNPPSLDNLMFVANGLIQNVIDPSAANSLYFKLDPRKGLLSPITGLGLRDNDPMPDELRSVTLEQSTDGELWTRLPIEEISEGEYRADVPVVGAAQLYSFRISALDKEGNTFKHTCQMPVGKALQIPTATPTATATATETETPNATPTATATATETETPNATNTPAATGTPRAIPTPVAIPTALSPATDETSLPRPKVRIRNGRLTVKIPAISSVDLSKEKGLAMNWLESRGFIKNDAQAMITKARWKARCGIDIKYGKLRRLVSDSLSARAARVISVGNAPRLRQKVDVSYSCRFSMVSPQSFATGQIRRSEVVTLLMTRSTQ